uniref:Uncharacterized protein n=1 Tax=Anopheles atroparvus TaxID=41427 RepID=A0AAG5CN74_ANOAO
MNISMEVLRCRSGLPSTMRKIQKACEDGCLACLDSLSSVRLDQGSKSSSARVSIDRSSYLRIRDASTDSTEGFFLYEAILPRRSSHFEAKSDCYRAHLAMRTRPDAVGWIYVGGNVEHRRKIPISCSRPVPFT